MFKEGIETSVQTNVFGRENKKCKGPEVAMSPVSWKNIGRMV